MPLLSLGIPGSNSAAVLLGGFLVHGLQPGPMLFEKAPEVVYGLYGGLLIANIAMVAIGLVILTPCIWLVNRPKPWLIAFVLALVVSGVYSVHQSVFEIGLVLGIGVVGYVLRCCKVPPLPMVLGVVLGFMIESNYRRSLLLTGGDHSIFYTDKVSLGLLALAAVLTTYSLWREFARPAPRQGQDDRHEPVDRAAPSSTVAERIAAIVAALPRTTPPATESDLQFAADRRRRPLLRGAHERLHAGHARGHRRAGRLHGDRPCRRPQSGDGGAVQRHRRPRRRFRRHLRRRAGACRRRHRARRFSRPPSGIGLSGADVGLGIAVGCEIMCRLCHRRAQAGPSGGIPSDGGVRRDRRGGGRRRRPATRTRRN